MSDFRAVLDEEVASAVDDSIKKNHRKKFKFSFSISRFFSIRAFIKTILFFVVLMGSIMAWIYFSSDKTNSSFKNKLASKTVPVERNQDKDSFRVASSHKSTQNAIPRNLSSGDPLPMDRNEPTPSTIPDEIVSVKPAVRGALTAAPVPELYESLPEGIIPKARLSDGMTPFNAYKRPFLPQTNKPKISFVVTGVGMSRSMTKDIIKSLPPEISFGLSPYAPDLKLLSDAARSEGHETWMMLPLQNENYPLNDPGPATLFITASIEQNQARLLSIMGKATGYVGFISWEDHIYTAKDVETSSYIQQIFGRGLGIIDSAVSADRDYGRNMAYSNEFPFVKNNFWLDQNLEKGAMTTQLKRLENLATARGEAIMLLHPYPKSIQTIQKWLKSNSAKSFEIVPASYLAEYKDE